MKVLQWNLLLGVALSLLGPLLAHFRLLPPAAGLILYTAGGSLTLLGLAVSWWGTGEVLPVPLLAAALLVACVFLGQLIRGLRHPLINDLTTDPHDPPAFRTLALGQEGRDLSYPPAFRRRQEEAYPFLQPLLLPFPPREVWRASREIVTREASWEWAGGSEEEGRLEFTARSRLFRFPDDVVVRIRSAGEGRSRVDVRWKSRLGRGDWGANAGQIQRLLSLLEEQLREGVS